MRYITSGRYTFHESAEEIKKDYWFNLWRRKLWPYAELKKGDILYFYESPSKRIVWKCRVTNVYKFPYSSKKDAGRKLVSRYGDFDRDSSYFMNAPEKGYCLAWKVRPLQRMSLIKPSETQFPRQGWLRADTASAMNWLSQVAPDESEMPVASDTSEPPSRVRFTTTRTIRDTVKAKDLKTRYDFRCQVCGDRIEIGKHKFYAEVHHIRPLGGKHGGLDREGNMLVLCPNHHAMFDFGIVRFLSTYKIKIGKHIYRLSRRHTLDKDNTHYYNRLISGSSSDPNYQN